MDINSNIKKPNGTFGYALMMGLFYMTINAVLGMAVVYLSSAGFGHTFIGIVIAVCSLIASFLVIPLGSVTDKSKKYDVHHVLMVCVLSMVIAAGLILLGFKTGAMVIILFGLLMTVVQMNSPLLNALGMHFENNGVSLNFGVARGIGSAMYAVASIVISWLAKEEVLGPAVIPVSILILNAAFFVTIFVFGNVNRYLKKNDGAAGAEITGDGTNGKTAGKTDDGPDAENEKNESVGKTGESLGTFAFMKKYPWFIFFIFSMVVLFIPYNALANYMIVVVKPMGGDVSVMGWVLGLGAVFEIPTMFLFSRLRSRFKGGSLILFAGIFFTAKTAATLGAFVCGSIPMLYAAQLLQMLSYALIVPAAVYFGNEMVEKENEVQSQSFNGFSIIMGSVLGSTLGGYLSEALSVTIMLITITVISAVGSLLLIVSVTLCEKHMSDKQVDIKM